MTEIEKLIGIFETQLSICPTNYYFVDFTEDPHSRIVLLEALREKAERDNPKPLTEEQIRGMVGRWAWYKSTVKAGWDKIIEIVFDEDPMAGMPEIIIFDSGEEYLIDMLGTHYNLYAHEPKERKI